MIKDNKRDFTTLEAWKKCRKRLKLLIIFLIISNFTPLASIVTHFTISPIAQFPSSLFAQSNFFGYYEAEFDQLKFTKQSYNFGYNKLRLDFETHPDDAVTIGANVNIQKYFGSRTWNMLDFLPKDIWQPIFQLQNTPKEMWITEFPIAVADTLFLDNVYLKAAFKYFDLTVGKQQISLGKGYAWNPLDIFNVKQLLDPTYEQTGVNAVRAEIPVKDRTSLDFILSPKSDWDNSVKMMQLKTGIAQFDITGTVAQYNWKRTNLDLQGFSIAELTEQRTLLGGAIEGELFGIGLRAEGAWNLMENQDDFTEIILGADYTFTNGMYILMEYLHNENGAKDLQNLELNSYLQYLNGETHSLMQNYLFSFLNYPLSGFLQFGVLTFANLNDNSVAINPQLTWDMFQDVGLTLMYSQYIGDDNTEFGLQDWGWRIRLRGYF